MVPAMRYVALLRGIGPANPNMRNEKLRGVLEELGLANVASVISSGNLLFDTEDGAADRHPDGSLTDLAARSRRARIAARTPRQQVATHAGAPARGRGGRLERVPPQAGIDRYVAGGM